jgi:hypothetical protein
MMLSLLLKMRSDEFPTPLFDLTDVEMIGNEKGFISMPDPLAPCYQSALIARGVHKMELNRIRRWHLLI